MAADRRRWSMVPVAIGVVLAASGVVAAADVAPVSMSERVRAEERDSERRLVVLGRARLAYPQRFAAGASAMLVRRPRDWDCTTVCRFRGPLFRVEPGLDGLRLGAGFASLVGEARRHERFVGTVFVGWSLEAAVLRTWHDAPLDPVRATYVGGTAGFTVTRVNFSVGVFRRTESGGAADRWIATGGVGWGF